MTSIPDPPSPPKAASAHGGTVDKHSGDPRGDPSVGNRIAILVLLRHISSGALYREIQPHMHNGVATHRFSVGDLALAIGVMSTARASGMLAMSDELRAQGYEVFAHVDEANSALPGTLALRGGRRTSVYKAVDVIYNALILGAGDELEARVNALRAQCNRETA